YTLSAAVLRVLRRREYAYDASTLPTYLGPLARAYYFRATQLDSSGRDARAQLFGHFSDGRRPLRPYYWIVDGGELLEMPIPALPARSGSSPPPSRPAPPSLPPPPCPPLRAGCSARVPDRRDRAVDPPAPRRFPRTR